MARRTRSNLKPVSDVQLTSFMDLTFLLLIVFILTAPGLEYGVDVSPPKMTATPLEDKKSYVITLNDRGEVVFQKEPVSLEALASKLKFLAEAQPDMVVLVRAGQKRAYGEVVDILRLVRQARVRNVSLITQAEDI